MTENSNKDIYGSVNTKCSYLPRAFGGNIYVVSSEGGICDIRDLKHRERWEVEKKREGKVWGG